MVVGGQAENKRKLIQGCVALEICTKILDNVGREKGFTKNGLTWRGKQNVQLIMRRPLLSELFCSAILTHKSRPTFRRSRFLEPRKLDGNGDGLISQEVVLFWGRKGPRK